MQIKQRQSPNNKKVMLQLPKSLSAYAVLKITQDTKPPMLQGNMQGELLKPNNKKYPQAAEINKLSKSIIFPTKRPRIVDKRGKPKTATSLIKSNCNKIPLLILKKIPRND